MVSPGLTRKSRPVTRSTWKEIAFSPGCRRAENVECQRRVAEPIASAVTCEPSGTAKMAGWPETALTERRGVPMHRVGLDLLLANLVGGDRVTDLDRLGGDEDGLRRHFLGPLVRRAG